jgi:hypothetical protein
MPSTEEDQKKALKAFKKRMKLTRLDDESKIGHGPMSGGGREQVISIQPPAGFGKEIWEELTELGFLKRDGIGFYQLVEGKNF